MELWAGPEARDLDLRAGPRNRGAGRNRPDHRRAGIRRGTARGRAYPRGDAEPGGAGARARADARDGTGTCCDFETRPSAVLNRTRGDPGACGGNP